MTGSLWLPVLRHLLNFLPDLGPAWSMAGVDQGTAKKQKKNPRNIGRQKG